MSIDMKQFHAVFFEESQEHLDDMEHLLIGMDLSQPNPEDLHSIFRAAHSIKGGSGIFGFDALGSLTHVLENLLDKLRQGQLQPTATLVDSCLQAVDLSKLLLQSYRQGDTPDWAGVQQMSERLEAQAGKPSPVETQGYGFFVPLETTAEDAGYGFFDEPDAPAADPGYGFFEDPPPPVSAEVPAVAAPVEKKPSSPGNKPQRDTESQESASIRVDVGKVDQLMNLVGEIVITQSMLNLLGKQFDGSLGEKFQTIAAELERNTRDIQEAVMSIRMLPVSFVFNRFPRVVRDLSQKLGKAIDLVIEGGETELDKGLTEKLVDPLTHLVRNSIDHGIEPEALRQSRGKPARGCVTLRAAQQGGAILIVVSDDGGGLDRERILTKAREKHIPIGDNPADEDVWQLIFAPGFSTASSITDVSGRGVGLDVVRRNVATLGGRIDIHSVPGEGTSFSIHLPLTLAIVDGMGVAVGDQTFIIPLVNIVECMQPAAADLKTLAGQDQLLWVRDQYWPLIPLYREMQLEPRVQDPASGIVVLIESSKRRFALFVDGLVGQQQVVIKSLEQHYRRIRGVAGATIMGDGSVALILDVESLAGAVEHVSECPDDAA